MSGQPQGYVAVLSYHDRSGILAVWGPWPTEAQADKGVANLKSWPIEDGIWEIKPLLPPVGGGAQQLTPEVLR